MASPPDAPRDFAAVLALELEEIARRRAAARQPAPRPDDLAGLAFSGGGIRSATFCLGVLQALRERGILPRFDYLSTVSGGGFVGGWWSAWLSRPWHEVPAHRRPADPFFPGPERIEPERAPEYQDRRAPRKEGSLNAAVDPVHHLRLFSNYLTPRKGVLGADTWRAVAITARNVLLTWVVLLPLLFAAVVAGQLYFVATPGAALVAAGAAPAASLAPGAEQRAFLARDAAPGAARRAVLVERARLAARPVLVVGAWFALLTALWLLNGAARRSATLSGLVVASFVAWKLHEAFGAGAGPPLLPGAWTTLLLAGGFVIVARFVLAPLAGLLWRGAPRLAPRAAPAAAAPPGASSGGWERASGRASRAVAEAAVQARTSWERGAGRIAECLADGWRDARGARTMDERIHALWARLTEAVEDGSTFRRERRRNVIAAWQARLLVVGTLLTVALGVAGFAHEVVRWALGAGGPVARAGGLLSAALAVGSAVFTAAKGAPTGAGDAAGDRPTLASRLVFAVAPALFLGALLVGFATLSWRLLATYAPPAPAVGPLGWALAPLEWATLAGALVCLAFAVAESWTDAGAIEPGARWLSLRVAGLSALGALALAAALWSVNLRAAGTPGVPSAAHALAAGLALLAACATGVVALGWSTDPNLIAMHAFYKARLVRAYLGASNPHRVDHEIRDSAPHDDVRLHKLRNCERGAPYHLINATVNLTAGSDLATAQRHAASFVLSQHACGSVRTGWRPTREYMSGRLTLGAAVAISGAAASPTMGTKTPSGALSMLLALFNVRLGYWAPTPNRPRWRSRQAGLWPFYLVREFLSQTTDLSVYSYLSDGGHFDNTGVYSLIERGCRQIVVADCGADPEPSFADVGDLIRRCRIDFGAEVRLDARRFLKNPDGVAGSHVVVGTVVYAPEHAARLGWDAPAGDDTDAGRKARTGIVVWIKPALTGAERADIRQYAIANAAFPQQSTADQWFDEAQFESYRSLGYKSGYELPAFWDIDTDAIADAEAAARAEGARNDLAAWLLNGGWARERLGPALRECLARYELARSDAASLEAELARLLDGARQRHYRDEIVKPLLDRRGVRHAERALDRLVVIAARFADGASRAGRVTAADIANARADMNGEGWPF